VGASSSKTGDADGYVFKALLEAGRFIAAHLILAKIADRADCGRVGVTASGCR
jgi:hypothetical protein